MVTPITKPFVGMAGDELVFPRPVEPEDIVVSEASTDVFVQSLRTVFPDMFVSKGLPEEEVTVLALQNIEEYALARTDEFVNDLIEFGRAPDTEVILRGFGATEQDMVEIFSSMEETGEPLQSLVEPVTVEIDGVRQLVARTEDNSLYNSRGNWVGFYNWADDTVFNPYKAEGLGEKARASFVAGIGDVLSVSGGAARWLGYDDVGDKLSTTGAQLQISGVPNSSADFQVSDLLNPEFYATKIVRAVPFALSLAPLAIGGYYAGAGVAASVGLGTIWQMVIGGIAGATLSRPAESAMEAGGQYDDAIARGKTEKEAKEEADEVFRNNMVLAGADAWEIAIALAPTPKWVPTSLIKGGLVRTARIAGKMVIVGLSEGGEEIYQDMIQRHARGEEWKLDPVSKEVFAIGAVMGMGMGLGGDVISSVVNKSKQDMPANLKRVFDDSVKGFKAEGFKTEQSELRALDVVAKTPEGESFIQKVIRTVRDERGAISGEEITPEGTLSVDEVAKYETRIPLDLIRKDEKEYLAKLTEQIKKEGITEPIVIRIREDGSHILWDGIHRFIVAQDLGIKNIPVRFIGEEGLPAKKPPTPPTVTPTEGVRIPVPKTTIGVIPENIAEATRTFEASEPLSNEGIPLVPETPISKSVADNTNLIKDIGVKERWLRNARKVFEKLGQYPLYKGIQKAEVLVGEERVTRLKEQRDLAKKIDTNRRYLVNREANESGSVVGLTYDEKRAVTYIRKWANEWADIKGLAPNRRIKDYIPHLFEQEMIAELKVGKLDPAMARMLDEKTQSKITDPFLKERLGATGFLEDPFAAMEAYDAVALRVLYYEPHLQQVALIANDPTTPKHIKAYLNDYSRRMTGEMSPVDEQMNITWNEILDIIRPLPGGKAFADKLGGGNPAGIFSYNMTGVLYPLWMGYKVTTAIRNLSQHTLTIGEVGIKHFGNGIRMRFTVEGKAALKESLVLRGRKLAFLAGLDDSFLNRLPKGLQKSAMFMFRVADLQNVSDAFLAGYSEAKELLPNAGKKVWIERGDEVAADTQFLYTKMNSMAISQTAPGRQFAMLTTWTGNWMELMTKWVSKRPSSVYTEYEKATGEKATKAPWSSTYKSILTYMLIVGLGKVIEERERLKVWEYTGVTSLRYLAGVVGGEFPGLELQGAIADFVTGVTMQDERMIKSGWNNLLRTITPSILKQVEAVATGEKDWLTLLFYLKGKDFKLKQLEDKWEKGWESYEDLSDVTKRGQAYPTYTQAKAQSQWRIENPKLEAQMFVSGNFTTLSSEMARQEVLRLIEANNIDTELIPGYDKIFGVDTATELAPFKNRIGNLEKLTIDEEAEYFDMGSFAEQVHKLVNSQGKNKVLRDGDPLATELLNAEDLWRPYFDYEEDGARKLWRQQFPEGEAQLYLWGKVQAFENPESATELLRLMKKYNIPPQAINAFQQDPSKYDELFTQKFELETKWFDMNTEYENFGNSEAPNFIEDKDARKEARDKFKEDNPNWVADMRRIEAIDNDASPEIIEKWAERGKTIDEFSAGSSEAKVWLLDNPDTHKWALNTDPDNPLLSDDGSDWNEAVLRVNVKWRERDEAYAGFGDKDASNYIEDDEARMKAREDYLSTNSAYNDDRRRRDMYSLNASSNLVEEYVAYGKVVDEFHSNSAEANLFRIKHPELSAFGQDEDTLDWEPLDETKVPIWEIDADYAIEDAEYQAILDKYEGREETKATNDYLYNKRGQPTEYCVKRYERKAYESDVPTKYVGEFVDFYTNPQLKKPANWDLNVWYEDDWWMQEHKGFYRDVYLGILGNDRKDYRLVPPTRKLGAKYIYYKRIDNPGDRDTYRLENTDLDEWGVSVGIWTTTMTEKRRRSSLSPASKTEERVADIIKEIEALGK